MTRGSCASTASKCSALAVFVIAGVLAVTCCGRKRLRFESGYFKLNDRTRLARQFTRLSRHNACSDVSV